MINLELYKIFVLVAKEENLTRASEKLNLTQPAVTKHIKNLSLCIIAQQNQKIKPFYKNFLIKIQNTKSTARKITLRSVKIPIYLFFSLGAFLENSEKVIRLARDAIIVPVPPIFTPKSRGT